MYSYQKSERDGDHAAANKRLVELATYGEKKSKKQNDLHESFTAQNGKNYGIVKQAQYYYIMEAEQGATHSNDYSYIDGIMYKNKYRFNNLAGAEKRLYELKANKGELIVEQEAPQPRPEEDPAPAPQPEPMPEVEPEPQAQTEPQPEQEPTPDEGMDAMKEINSLMGKLGYELRNTEVNTETAVSLMKQLIAALPMGELSQEEKDELSLSIKHGKSEVKGYETAGPPEDGDKIDDVSGDDLANDELGVGDEMGGEPDFDDGIDEMLEAMEKSLEEMEMDTSLDEAFEQSKELLGKKKISTKNYFN